MLIYILKRLIMATVVVFLALAFLASMVNFIPGDPVTTILGPRASPAMSARVRSEMLLDRPIPVQIYFFFVNAIHGDLGKDFVSNLPVIDLLAGVLPHTLLLALTSLILSVCFGVPIGIISATRPNSWIDRLTGFFAVSFITIPPFVTGLLLLLLFAVFLRILPATGLGDLDNPIDYLRHLALPAIAMSLTWIGYISRLIRGSVLEVLGANYIRTAKAFGLPERKIFFKYALKNAIIPTIAILGVGMGNLVGGAIFVEVIFTRPGLGFLIYNAIMSRNYPIVRGGIAVAAFIFVIANLLADLSYRLIDPRISLSNR